MSPAAAAYGEKIASHYDDLFAGLDPSAAVATLAELAGPGGRALELGIGTGRVAIPLAKTGVRVVGLDASPAMVAKLRAKPGGSPTDIRVHEADFTDPTVAAADGPFDVVFCAFNTFFALPDQESQVSCFARVASLLSSAGRFVLEAFVPDPTRFTRGQALFVNHLDPSKVILEASRHDPLTQRVTSHHVILSEAGTTLLPVDIRYAWPSELDLMARLAGLGLEHRWSSWTKDPFRASSGVHVSAWRK